MTVQHDKKILRKRFFKMVIPAVIGMLISALYVILDGIFVGKGLGESALGATNIVFPLNMLIISLTMLIAIGGANVFSFYKGKGENKKSENVFSLAMAMLMITGIIIGVTAFFLRRQICYFLGARGEMLEHAVKYLSWLAIIAPFQMTAFGLNVFVRNDNRPGLAMTAAIAGSVINAALDYYLILVLKKGIEFCAITNGIGAVIELCVSGTQLKNPKRTLFLRLPKILFSDIKRLLYNGFSSFLSEFSASTVIFSFNAVIVRRLGEQGVAAFSVVGYIGSVVIMLMIGVTNGAQPIMSLKHGMGNPSAVRYVKKLGTMFNLSLGVFFAAFCILFGKLPVALFHTGNYALEARATDYLRIYITGYIPVGVTLMNILYFQTTEKNRLSALCSLLRCAGFVHIFVFIFPIALGSRAVFYAFTAGELCNLVFTSLLAARENRRKAAAK